MIKLKTILLSEAGYYIHVGIYLTLVLFACQYFIAIPLLFAECLFLWKKHRRLFYLAFNMGIFVVLLLLFQSNRTPDQLQSSSSGIVTDVDSRRLTIKCQEKRWYVYIDSEVLILPGDVIEFSGKMIESNDYQIPHVFNYQKYLKSINIEGAYFATEIVVVNSQFHINQMKLSIKNYISRVFTSEVAAIMILLLMGDDSLIESAPLRNITDLGITHLFAISGMHVGLIVAMLSGLLKKFHLRIETIHIISIIVLIIYCFLTGFSISMIRASLLMILVFLKDNKTSLFSKLDLMTFIFIGFIFYNPNIIFNVGFQLSFLISFAIMLGEQYINSEWQILKILKLTTLATLFSLPVILEMSGKISLWVIPLSVFFTLFVSIIILPGMFLTLFIPFFEPLFGYIVRLFFFAIQELSKYNIMIKFNWDGAFFKMAYWMILLLFFIKSITFTRIVVTVLSFFALILVQYTFYHFPHITKISVLDVGQGDAIHLHDRDCDILIDTGPPDSFDRLISYFNKSNIHNLDAVFITHEHGDHQGELNDLINQMNVKNLFTTRQKIYNNQFKSIVPYTGETWSCGEFEMFFVHVSHHEVNENNNSMVITVHFDENVWLFTGDIERKIEDSIDEEILATVDVIKVAHHGSSTSSTQEFTERMNPEYAIISVGKYNRYGHPDPSVVKRWIDRESIVLKTSDNGSIHFIYYPFRKEPMIWFSDPKRPYFSYLK